MASFIKGGNFKTDGKCQRSEFLQPKILYKHNMFSLVLYNSKYYFLL